MGTDVNGRVGTNGRADVNGRVDANADGDAERMRGVAEAALPHWGVVPAKLELVSRSENLVFRVDGQDGGAYALRIHRPGYHTLEELESEPLWLAALDKAGVAAPVALPGAGGRHYAEVPVPGTDEFRHVGLVPWFEGVSLAQRIREASDPAVRDACFSDLGRLMAAMHEQAVDWQPPAGFRRHALDADGFAGEAPFWGRFWDLPQLTTEQREILSDARLRIHAWLQDYGTQRSTYSMIHADLHAANVLVADERVFVIDFDDAGFGWHQYDMAVALFDHAASDDFDAVWDALVAGYRSRRAISDEDLALVPMFVLVRMVASLGWLHDRPEVALHQFLPALIELSCERFGELLTMHE